MKIKFTQDLISPVYGDVKEGDEHDVREETAKLLIENGYAEEASKKKVKKEVKDADNVKPSEDTPKTKPKSRG